MRDVEEKVIPVIMGATGTISQSVHQNLSNIPESMTSSKYRK